MRIAYQGEPGAYSEAAALRFKASADLLARESVEAVFVAVEEGATLVRVGTAIFGARDR